jgi:hypothetical protein
MIRIMFITVSQNPNIFLVGGPYSDKGTDHKVHIYLEDQGVFLLVGIGTPYPLSRKRVCTPPLDTGGKFATGVNDTGGKFAAGVNDAGGKLPPVSRRGEYTSLRVSGWVSPNSNE